MAISVFKSNALSVIDDISHNHETIVITRRGRALAQVIPFQGAGKKSVPGRLASSLIFERDIVSPINPDKWEANI
jgi:antitoxin (DNA-binding transcriptional repressor) of toxin-antitoxin stability system